MKRSIVLAIVLFLGMSPFLGYAEELDEEGEELISVESEGIHFQVPPDWPIVKRHGSLLPLPISEYLHQKMKTVTDRLNALDKKIEVLTGRLDQMEKQEKKE